MGSNNRKSCATEVFGLHRPEIGPDLYDFQLCAPQPDTLMCDGFFTLTGVATLDAADTADTLRALMRRETGLTPSAYRRRFSPTPAG